MTHLRRRFACLLVLLAIAIAPACAKERSDCMPVVRDGWIRLVPGGMPMQAGFGRIDNPCAMPATIIGAKSAAHASTELHETRIVDGVNRMRAEPELRIAPNDEVILKPGGLHLMLMDPRAPLKAGSMVAIEFPLQDGRVLRGEFVVRAP
jgi:hypothetical protein